jgi:DNA-binding transcriptional regulator YdaS (Cro superfamily)
MNPKAALKKAVELVKGQAEMARKLSELMETPVRQQHVWNWLNRDAELPAEYVIPMERATAGKVSRHDLRPDLYPRESATGSGFPQSA